MRVLFRLAVIPAAALLATAVLSYPTDFVVIPTAHVLTEDAGEVQLRYHGIQTFVGREYESRIGVQVGLGDGWEVGYDRRVGPPDSRDMPENYFRWDIQYRPHRDGWDRDWFNVKKQLFPENSRRPAVAVGIVNIGATVKEGRYVTVQKRFNDFDVLLGWPDVLDDEYVYEGIGYTINPEWDVRVEHVGRGRWSTNFALQGNITPDTSVSVGYMRANSTIYPDSWLPGVTHHFDIADF